MVQCLQQSRFPKLYSLSITHIPSDFSQATYSSLVDQEDIARVTCIALSGAAGVAPAENTGAGENNEDDEEPDENEIHSFLRAFTWLDTLELRGSAVRIGLKALELDLPFVISMGNILTPQSQLIIRDSSVEKEVVEAYESKRGELATIDKENVPLRIVYHNCCNIPGSL